MNSCEGQKADTLKEHVDVSGSSFIKYDFPFGQIQQLSNCVIDERTELLAVLLGSIQIDLHVSAEKHILITARLIRRLLSLLLLP